VRERVGVVYIFKSWEPLRDEGAGALVCIALSEKASLLLALKETGDMGGMLGLMSINRGVGAHPAGCLLQESMARNVYTGT
jgi:hypothetical protein